MVFDAVAGALLALATIAGWRGGLIGRLGAWVGFAAGGLATARWVGSGIELVNIDGQNQRLAIAAAAVLGANRPPLPHRRPQAVRQRYSSTVQRRRR